MNGTRLRLACWIIGCQIMVVLGCNDSSFKISNPYQIEIKGQDYQWHIQYPGKDGILYTTDDQFSQQNLQLPVKTEVEIILKSEDYLYFLELPDLQQIGMAVPEQTHYLRIYSNNTGLFDLRGSQMCAYTHKDLLGKVSVYSPFWFEFWQNRL